MTLPVLDRPSFPEMYEQWLVGTLFGPWAEVLLERVSLASGGSLLDVACGTGIVARTARKRMGPEARVVGVDVNPQMLAVGGAIAPEIEWLEGRAEALPFSESEVFDVVVCQQGLQFVPDRIAAAREMRRALRPGGRIGVATWRPLAETPFFREMHQAAERHLGPFTDTRHSFADIDAVVALVRDAGFEDVDADVCALTLRFPDAMLVRLNAMALAGMGLKGRDTTEAERERLATVIAEEGLQAVSEYRDGDGLTFESLTNIVIAV